VTIRKVKCRQTKYFPLPSAVYAIFVMFRERMRNVLRGKVWWLKEIVICGVYEVSVRIYFTSGENYLNNFVTACRTLKSKGKSFIGLYRS
jgi:hypothetical protein